MKKLSFFALAVTGMLLAACSDKDVNAEGGQGEARSEGYMSLAINLPTTPSTRALNDVFDDGLDDEYAVNNCALLLFEGNSESDATLFNAQYIILPFDDEDSSSGNTNITTSYLATAKVKGRTKSGNLYALALLNYDGVLGSINDAGLPVLNGSTTALPKTTKLSDLREKLISATDLTGNKKSFFMTNAVLSTVEGGVTGAAPTPGSVFQLAELNPEKIYDTEAKAKANPAGEILVERAVAKVTLSAASNFDYTIGDGTELEIASIEWAIDNIEPATYIVRNPGDLSYIGYSSDAFHPANYRFVGHTSTLANTTLGSIDHYYRTYWCVDPQYDDNTMTDKDGSGEKNSVNMVSNEPTGQFGEEYPQYCYENTFDVKHQSYRNTTRAVIKVTLKDNASFFTVEGGSKVGQTEAERQILTYIIKNTEVQGAFKDNLLSTVSGTSYTINDESVKVEYKRNSLTGQYEVSSLEVNGTLPAESFASDAAEKINDALKACIANINKNFVVFEYIGGVIYYEARFQHFAGNGTDDLAPWNNGEYDTTAPAGGSTGSAYPGDEATRAKNYLGRYGMVRNNWYYVEVSGIKKIGYPEIPSVTVDNPGYEDPDTPDDNLNAYISAKIHVLSWAKRTQSWGF